MTSSGVDFTEAVPLPDWAEHLEGCHQTAERVLETERARKYFTKRLASALHLGHRVQRVEEAGQHMRVDGKLYDLVIDATWGHFYPLPFDMFFEPTLLLYYRTSDKFPALTLIDGPLCSIYPTETSGLYTLSSVPFTPIAQVKTSAEAVAILQSVPEELIAKKRIQMEDQISRYVPNFRDIFEYAGPQFSIKTKHVGMNENRSCSVHRQGRLFSVMSGKTDTISLLSSVFCLPSRQNLMLRSSSPVLERGSSAATERKKTARRRGAHARPGKSDRCARASSLACNSLLSLVCQTKLKPKPRP
jgi:hypothetical protein